MFRCQSSSAFVKQSWVRDTNGLPKCSLLPEHLATGKKCMNNLENLSFEECFGGILPQSYNLYFPPRVQGCLMNSCMNCVLL